MDIVKETPALAAWAYLSNTHMGCVMVRGGDLQPGDVVYFSPSAYGCELFVKKSDFRWSAIRHKPGSHFKKDADIDPETWYVTRRVSAPKAVEGISRLRVDGDDLAVGDVVELPGLQEARPAEILTIEDADYASGWQRRATIRLSISGEMREHTFKSRSLMMFAVVDGPKLIAANADPALVLRIATGVLWKGGY